MRSIIILGRQPAIGLAELEALFLVDKVHQINDYAAMLDVPCQDIPFDRLGGAMKLGEIIGSTSINNLKRHLLGLAPQLSLPEQGKINLGLSAYDLKLSPKNINDLALTIKNQLKQHGHSVRTVPNRDTCLNTAQVWHNHLTGSHGLELLLVGHQNEILIARTVNVQDIKSYTIRDRFRPKRDMQVGMLPPKLAQIIINLAAATVKPTDTYLLDPFCGTGVILQEALLMGFNVYGSDIDPRMVDYSTTNLLWLEQKHPAVSNKYEVAMADAGIADWTKPIAMVASETYLGPILRQVPSDIQLANIISELDLLHKKFLQNIGRQLANGTRLCLAVPAWKVKGQFRHLPILDQLAQLGYNRLAFKHAAFGQLIYHRPEQIVARELVILIRK